ncbi:hypothetical protein RB201_23040 [Streptomyces sp. S1A(2023)]
MLDRREDKLELALLEVQALIESSVAIHRDHTVQEQLIASVDGEYGTVLDTAQNLINGATRSIDIVHARPPTASDQAARHSDRVERDLLRSAAVGVAVRLLTTPALLDNEFAREQFGSERPVEVRVARMPPLQAIIIDGGAAFVVTESAVGRRASVIRVPEVLRTLQAFFQSVWSDAAPAGEPTPSSTAGTGRPSSSAYSPLWEAGSPTRSPRARTPSPCGPTGVTWPRSCPSSGRAPVSRPECGPPNSACSRPLTPPRADPRRGVRTAEPLGPLVRIMSG